MNKILVFMLSFSGLCQYIIAGPIVVRGAGHRDLKQIEVLDRRVSFEFFKPLYEKYYLHLPVGKDSDFFLERELEEDKKAFPEHIVDAGKQIIVAEDDKDIVGFIVVCKENATLEIELLLVDKNYRGRGIGKKLVERVLSWGSGAKNCVVFPLRFGNERTLKFYRSLGFKDMGYVPKDKINSDGIPYADGHYYYILDL